jgi:hypothetical protein
MTARQELRIIGGNSIISGASETFELLNLIPGGGIHLEFDWVSYNTLWQIRPQQYSPARADYVSFHDCWIGSTSSEIVQVDIPVLSDRIKLQFTNRGTSTCAPFINALVLPPEVFRTKSIYWTVVHEKKSIAFGATVTFTIFPADIKEQIGIIINTYFDVPGELYYAPTPFDGGDQMMIGSWVAGKLGIQMMAVAPAAYVEIRVKNTHGSTTTDFTLEVTCKIQ